MLAGEPMARPDGLERALVRAGYEVGELELGDPVLGDGPAPDALVATAPHVEALTALARFPGVPAIFVCHGFRPWQESPIRHPRIARYVAVDEATRQVARLGAATTVLAFVAAMPGRASAVLHHKSLREAGNRSAVGNAVVP